MKIHNSLPNYNTMYQEKGIKGNTASQSYAEEMEKAAETKEESKSDTEIITRPDGSKVLMITNQIGGMQTVTSIKISQANPFQNDYKELPDVSEAVKSMD